MAENNKQTEIAKKAVQEMEQNRSTAQRGNKNSGKGTLPKNPSFKDPNIRKLK